MAIILDFVLQAADCYSIDATELLTDFIENNPVAHILRKMYIYKKQFDIYSLVKVQLIIIKYKKKYF